MGGYLNFINYKIVLMKRGRRLKGSKVTMKHNLLSSNDFY